MVCAKWAAKRIRGMTQVTQGWAEKKRGTELEWVFQKEHMSDKVAG